MALSKFLRRSGVAVMLIADHIKWKPNTIVHVGVGVYNKEIECFQEAWPEAKLIGFEPHPGVYKDLCKSYPGTIHPYAISYDNQESVPFYYKKTHKDGSSLYKHIDHDFETMHVEMRTLDSVLPVTQTALFGSTFLWLDCEGNELNALFGATRLMPIVDVVNVELTGKPNGVGWCSPEEVDRWLMNRGFLCQHIHTHRSSAGQRDAMYVRPHLFCPEYCCIPSEVRRFRKAKEEA